MDQFERMVAAYKHNHNRLARIADDMRRKAEAKTLKDRPKQLQYGRNRATWTGADEEHYLQQFFELEDKHRREIVSLERKLGRQAEAIQGYCEKHRINEMPELRSPPRVHPGIFFQQ